MQYLGLIINTKHITVCVTDRYYKVVYHNTLTFKDALSKKDNLNEFDIYMTKLLKEYNIEKTFIKKASYSTDSNFVKHEMLRREQYFLVLCMLILQLHDIEPLMILKKSNKEYKRFGLTN
jgi:hypothetical protein